jgi:hypothetical protein
MIDCDSVRQILQDIGYILTDHGKEFRAKPLYRDSDNDKVLRIWKDSGRWVDFKENKSGSIEDLVRLSLNLASLNDAKEWISSRVTNQAQDPREVHKQKPTIKQPSFFDKSLLTKLTRDCSYWNGRNISDKTILPFQGGVATTGKMYNRYVFPIFDYKDNIIGFAGRDVSLTPKSDRPKWKLIGDKKEWAFPLKVNLEEIKKSKTVILVESIGDMLALRENGINNSVVCFGLNISNKIIYTLISLNPEKIIIAFNNDSLSGGAGNQAAENERKKLLNYFDQNQILIHLPTDSNDFGEMNQNNPSQILEWYSKIK